MRGADANEFVELDLNGGAVAVLGILDQKYHQEGDDRRPRIDDELPGIRILKQGSRDRPDEDDASRNHECRRPAGGLRRLVRDITEDPAEATTVFSGSFLLLWLGFLTGHCDA